MLKVKEYKYGARSMEKIISMSRLSNDRKLTPESLPPISQISRHLDEADAKEFEKF